MEIQGDDGSKFSLENDSGGIVFGRGLGLFPDDPTVSRRHLSLQLRPPRDKRRIPAEPRVSFEVIGINPIWVRSGNQEEVRVFKRWETGELAAGDRFCLSARKPVWFTLKKAGVGVEAAEEKKRRAYGEDEEDDSTVTHPDSSDIDSIDVSGIDPVKEFGFLVKGHEFEHYPKWKIRSVRDWDWFLEEPVKDSDDEGDEECEKKKLSGTKRKKKKGKQKDDDDDNWTGESEDDKELVNRLRKAKSSGYSTRSKDQNKPTKASGRNKNPRQNKYKHSHQDDVESEADDEGDDTLGGFIVSDEDFEPTDESDTDEEDEEDEFLEEDDDDIDD